MVKSQQIYKKCHSILLMSYIKLHKRNIVLQADANNQIGAGHFMRMFAVGQIVSDMGFRVHFISNTENKSLLARLEYEGFILHRVPIKVMYSNRDNYSTDEFISLIQALNAQCLIFDGIGVNAELEKKLKKQRFKIIRVTDNPSQYCSADLLINPNYNSDNFKYFCAPHTQKALGLEYALLRKEFYDKKLFLELKKTANPKKILVSMGGSQINTVRILECFESTATSLSSDYQFEILNGVNSEEMALKMRTSHFGFISAGSTMWEAAKMELPFHAISLNEEQKQYLSFLPRNKIWFDWSHFEFLTQDIIRDIIKSYFEDPNLETQFIQEFRNLKIGKLTHELLFDFLS